MGDSVAGRRRLAWAAMHAPLSLAYVGRIACGTGVFESVYALCLARERGVAARLVIAGSGADEARLHRLVERLELAHQVRFAGPAFGAAKRELLAGADVSVVPACDRGMRQALLCSLEAGVPVIARRFSEAEDLVTNGVHGLLLHAGSPEEVCGAIRALSSNPALLGYMRAACRDRGRMLNAA